MKDNKLTFFKVAIVAVLGIATILGCEKNQDPPEENIQKLTISYNDERLFLSKFLAIPLEKVIYDIKIERFVIDGNIKMTMKEVDELHKIVNDYKIIGY